MKSNLFIEKLPNHKQICFHILKFFFLKSLKPFKAYQNLPGVSELSASLYSSCTWFPSPFDNQLSINGLVVVMRDNQLYTSLRSCLYKRLPLIVLLKPLK